jgi:hypothetical protein
LAVPKYNTSDLQDANSFLNNFDKIAGRIVAADDWQLYVASGSTPTDLWYAAYGGGFVAPVY